MNRNFILSFSQNYMHPNFKENELCPEKKNPCKQDL